ncbi:MAG TPA: hypothetical protein QGG59_02880 [Planctomycetota bacterium]|jgi:hypothetical protein|nr:hypothetical protein [Planctomycetota bacterium]MDP6128532.1 hypothetical protein [Planctomycetota bacterium]MDP7246337.1 hypothetical protein [Planctomycetota bacterium]HJM39041.1 hypothetical protein [Planctomycetota bacterium]
MKGTRILGAAAATMGAAVLLIHALLPAPNPKPASNRLPKLPPPANENLIADPSSLQAQLSQSVRSLKFPPEATQGFAMGEAALRAVALELPDVFPPMDFIATPQEGGIRLSWLPNPKNPVEGLRYEITRWAGDGGAEELSPTRSREYLDLVPCEGVPYRYRLRALVERRIRGTGGIKQVRSRSSAPIGSVATVVRSATWVAFGTLEDGRIQLSLARKGRPTLGPYATGPGEPIGDTGWNLEGLTLRETTVDELTSIPRFDALGRRVIISGQPADRTRTVETVRSLASIRLIDPCGSPLDLELLLPRESSASEDS